MDITEVTSKLFSISLAKQGDLVQGIAHINQCLRILLTTRPGSDPMRPTFGCDVMSKLDKPVNGKLLAALVPDVATAISTWMKEITVVAIQPLLSNAGALIVNVQWTFVNSTDVNTTPVNYGSIS